METESLTCKEDKRGGVASMKTYSAQKLAEVLKTSLDEFYSLNLMEQTRNWDLNYLTDFFYYLNDADQISVMVEYIVAEWSKAKGVLSSFEKANDRHLQSERKEFEDDITRARQLALSRINEELQEKERRLKMEAIFRKKISTAEEQTCSGTTDKPADKPDVETAPEYRIADLTKESQDTLLIDSDKKFSELTDICRNEIWPWIRNNKLKSANVVRYIFRFKGIIISKCCVRRFTNLFNEMVPEANLVQDTVSSYQEANNTDFLKYNDLPAYSKLKRDGDIILKMIQPILDDKQAA